MQWHGMFDDSVWGKTLARGEMVSSYIPLDRTGEIINTKPSQSFILPEGALYSPYGEEEGGFGVEGVMYTNPPWVGEEKPLAIWEGGDRAGFMDPHWVEGGLAMPPKGEMGDFIITSSGIIEKIIIEGEKMQAL